MRVASSARSPGRAANWRRRTCSTRIGTTACKERCNAGVGAVDEAYFGQIWWGNVGNMWLLNDVVMLPWE